MHKDKDNNAKDVNNTDQSTQQNKAQSLRAYLAKNHPSTIKDKNIDYKAIANILEENYCDMQGYELQFVGKGLANALYSLPCTKALKLEDIISVASLESSESDTSKDSNNLKDSNGYNDSSNSEDIKESKDSNNIFNTNESLLDSKRLGVNESKDSPHPISQNNIIIGDNIDALKILKQAYFEKIKCIYIDPPYNTQSDNFIYSDNFRKDYEQLLFDTGLLNYDSQGKKEESDLLKYFKNRLASKTHSAWLCFMLPRLKLARDLLTSNGVIFISCDDNECFNLKLLCDEIFGENNFVCNMIRKTKSTTNDTKIGLNNQHEYLLCYAKDKEKINLLGGMEKDLSRYQNVDNDPLGAWIGADPSAKSGSVKSHFAITNPYTGKIDYPPKGRYWRFSQNTIQKHIDEGRLVFKREHKDNERGFIYKRFLKDLKSVAKTFDTLVFAQNEFMNQHATKELYSLGLHGFDYPKGSNFIKEILRHSTTENDIVLDFFAGSGTTAQAVLELNKEDNGNRKFILVQIDEIIDKKKSPLAYDFFTQELKKENPVISDITIERVKRVIDRIQKELSSKKKENENKLISEDKNIDTTSLSFNIYSIVDAPKIIDANIFSPNLSSMDRARNLALSANKLLDSKIIEIIEDKLYICEDVYLVTSSNNKVVEILQQNKDRRVYIDGYADIDLQDFLNLNVYKDNRFVIVMNGEVE